MTDLLVIGDVNPDIVVSGVPDPVGFGQAEQLVDAIDLVVGGSASITACGAARLDCRVALAGVVGDDALGAWLRARLGDLGVDTTPVRTQPGTPTGASVLLDRGADRAILTQLGTIPALAPADLAALPDRPARHVHVASYFLMGAELRAALPGHLARWRAAGATTSVDTNWDPSLRWQVADLIAHADLFLPNEAEEAAIRDAGGLAGFTGELVVKQGVRGAVWRAGGRSVRVLARAAEPFVDATGAGDSFNAGFLAGRLTGLGPAEALAWGVAAGTLSTRGRGGTATQGGRDEVSGWAAGLEVEA